MVSTDDVDDTFDVSCDDFSSPTGTMKKEKMTMALHIDPSIISDVRQPHLFVDKEKKALSYNIAIGVNSHFIIHCTNIPGQHKKVTHSFFF